MDGRRNPAFNKAKNHAFRLLKFRMRSEKELVSRLKQRNFDNSVINEVISYLKDIGLVDDETFTRMWIESRIKKPLGLNRLRTELKLKGIRSEIIDDTLSQIKERFNEEEAIAKLAQRKLSSLKGLEPYKAKRRLYAYLVQRGFTCDAITGVLENL